MSLQSRLQDFITAVGADIKALQTGLATHTHAGGGGTVSGSSAILTATQANSTVTPAVLTGHTWTIPPGKTLLLNGNLIFRMVALTTGAGYGVRVAQGAGANGNAQGSWTAESGVATGNSTGGLRNGGVFNVAGGANALGEALGTGGSSTSADHSAFLQAVIKNNSSNADTTVTVLFRSEVAASAITAQIGTGAVGVIV